MILSSGVLDLFRLAIINYKKYKIILICIAFLVIVFLAYIILPVDMDANPPVTWGFSVDWKVCIRPDTLLFLSGKSPYQFGCGLNPPWTYLLISPIALLPVKLGAAVIFVVTYFVYIGVFLKSRAKLGMILGLILSPFIYLNAYNGNIDWLPVLGFIFPPQIGLFFVVIKPQIGAGIALFWLIEAWRVGRLKKVLWVFSPLTIIFIISLIIYRLWPANIVHMTDDPYNASFWPVSLLVGIPLLIFGVIKREINFTIAATPFLAPYLNIHSYAVVLFGVIKNKIAFILLTILPWLVIIYILFR